MMNKKLIPTWHAKSYKDIDVKKLVKEKCKLLFCDLDNTLASPYQEKADQDVINFVESLKKEGINIVLLSNNHEKRVKTFALDLNITYLYEVKKPKIFKLEKFLENSCYNKDEIISIGDQIMTDVLCANRLGVRVILVDKLTKKDEPITFFPRLIDKIVRRKLKRKKLMVEF